MSKKELAKILASVTVGAFAGEGIVLVLDNAIDQTEGKEAIDWCAKNDESAAMRITSKIMKGGLKVGTYATGVAVSSGVMYTTYAALNGASNIARKLLK